MLLTAVILILQETLEAAVLVSILLVICFDFVSAKTWLPWSFAAGLLLAFVYAENMAQISEWFDYVGQEVVNATLQLLISVLVILFTWAYSRADGSDQSAASHKRWMILLAIPCIALAMSLEGSEVLLYIGGFLQQRNNLDAVLIGGGIGFGIGISVGVLLFYLLIGLPLKSRKLISLALLALFSGNMLSQALLQLTQADWISSFSIVWDSSDLLPEDSLVGQLLYALIGYEATPSYVQLAGYLTGIVLVLLAAMVGRYSDALQE